MAVPMNEVQIQATIGINLENVIYAQVKESGQKGPYNV